MKKVALSLAVLATIALASCGNKAANNDSDSVVAEEVLATDTVMDTANGTESITTTEAEVVEAAPATDDKAKAEEPKADDKAKADSAK